MSKIAPVLRESRPASSPAVARVIDFVARRAAKLDEEHPARPYVRARDAAREACTALVRSPTLEHLAAAEGAVKSAWAALDTVRRRTFEGGPSRTALMIRDAEDDMGRLQDAIDQHRTLRPEPIAPVFSLADARRARGIAPVDPGVKLTAAQRRALTFFALPQADQKGHPLGKGWTSRTSDALERLGLLRVEDEIEVTPLGWHVLEALGPARELG